MGKFSSTTLLNYCYISYYVITSFHIITKLFTVEKERGNEEGYGVERDGTEYHVLYKTYTNIKTHQ